MNSRFPGQAGRGLALYLGAVLAGGVLGWVFRGERWEGETSGAEKKVAPVETSIPADSAGARSPAPRQSPPAASAAPSRKDRAG